MAHLENTLIDYSDLDYSYLKNIKLRTGDELYAIEELDTESEIQKLQEEISALDTSIIPFDKWDFVLAFALGLLEVASDFMFSDHNQKNSVAYQMSDPNTNLGKAFGDIHKIINHTGQPLDYQGVNFAGGDHRGKTFAHDVLMLPLAIYMLCSGNFVDGYYEKGHLKRIITSLNQYGNGYSSLSLDEAITAYFLHMLADFFSAKSLPIPGFSILTHFPNESIRGFACDLYKDGLNMCNLAMQGIPVATVESLMWIYTELRCKDSDYSKEQIKNKKEKLLLLSHSIAMAVNIGKVVFTKEITSLNLPMAVRTVYLVWKEVKREIEYNHNLTEKVMISTIKNQLEVGKTLILLDDAIYYTRQIDELILNMQKEFEENNDKRRKSLQNLFSELDHMMSDLKRLNSEE